MEGSLRGISTECSLKRIQTASVVHHAKQHQHHRERYSSYLLLHVMLLN